MPATKRTTTPAKQQRNRSPAKNSSAKNSEELSPGRDLLNYVKEYARDQPATAAAWCFGIGFIVGWRLKPW